MGALQSWLPPYCSDFNLIERFWRYLKDLACANKLEDNIENVITTTEKFLNAQVTILLLPTVVGCRANSLLPAGVFDGFALTSSQVAQALR